MKYDPNNAIVTKYVHTYIGTALALCFKDLIPGTLIIICLIFSLLSNYFCFNNIHITIHDPIKFLMLIYIVLLKSK